MLSITIDCFVNADQLAVRGIIVICCGI